MNTTKRKEISVISREWDDICCQRQEAIISGKDISYIQVIEPTIVEELKGFKSKRLLDVGCGTGVLTNTLTEYSQNCTGIDVSEKSISIAKNNYQKDGLLFIQTAMKDYKCDQLYDICVSCMALMSDPDYVDTLKSIRKALERNGVLLVLITHPCFWAKYWKIDDKEWFNYEEEIYIEHDFSISLVKSIGKATYIHRPLEQYYMALSRAGYTIEKIKEAYPVGELPDGYKYDFPRFMLFRCRAN